MDAHDAKSPARQAPPEGQPLTPRQQRFAEEYLRDCNATQAALRAGYAKRGAHVQGRRLLGHPGVKAWIDAARRRAHSGAVMSHREAVELLTAMARADITDFLTPEGGFDPSRGPRGSLESFHEETDGRGGRKLRVRLANRLHALELLCKLMGYGAGDTGQQNKITIVLDGAASVTPPRPDAGPGGKTGKTGNGGLH